MILEICKYMGWSYGDYSDAPLWLLDAIMIRMSEEAAAQRALEAQQNHGTRS